MSDADVMHLSIQIASSFYDRREELMRGLDLRSWIDVAVAVLGAVTAGICACRMGRLTSAHRWAPRVSYVSLFTGSFCLVFAPWLFGHTYVRLGSLVFASAVIVHLVVLGREWWHGRPPKEMETKPGDLS